FFAVFASRYQAGSPFRPLEGRILVQESQPAVERCIQSTERHHVRLTPHIVACVLETHAWSLKSLLACFECLRHCDYGQSGQRDGSTRKASPPVHQFVTETIGDCVALALVNFDDYVFL